MGNKRQLLDELRVYDFVLILTHLLPKYFPYILKENINTKQTVTYLIHIIINLDEGYNTAIILHSLNFTNFTRAKDKDFIILHKLKMSSHTNAINALFKFLQE